MGAFVNEDGTSPTLEELNEARLRQAQLDNAAALDAADFANLNTLADDDGRLRTATHVPYALPLQAPTMTCARAIGSTRHAATHLQIPLLVATTDRCEGCWGRRLLDR
jgi:hypothetical protein